MVKPATPQLGQFRLKQRRTKYAIIKSGTTDRERMLKKGLRFEDFRIPDDVLSDGEEAGSDSLEDHPYSKKRWFLRTPKGD